MTVELPPSELASPETPASAPVPPNRWGTLAEYAALLIGIGLFVIIVGITYYRNHKSAKLATISEPRASITIPTNYNDPTNSFHMAIPDGWQIQTDVAQPLGVKEQVALAPTAAMAAYQKQTGSDAVPFVTIDVLSTKQDAKAWFDGLGLPLALTTSSFKSVDNDPIYRAETVSLAGLDQHYVITHDGTLLHVTFREHVSDPTYQADNSQYLDAFSGLVVSLQFGNPKPLAVPAMPVIKDLKTDR